MPQCRGRGSAQLRLRLRLIPGRPRHGHCFLIINISLNARLHLTPNPHSFQGTPGRHGSTHQTRADPAESRLMMIVLFIVLSRNKLRIPLEGTYS